MKSNYQTNPRKSNKNRYIRDRNGYCKDYFCSILLQHIDSECYNYYLYFDMVFLEQKHSYNSYEIRYIR
jgi:hypothetical protein